MILQIKFDLDIYAAAKAGDLEALISQVQRGADPFIPDENGSTPLFLAEFNDQDSIVAWYDKEYPSKFPVLNFSKRFIEEYDDNKYSLKQFLVLDEQINRNLRWCGLRSFSLDFSTQSENIPAFISKIFDSLSKGLNKSNDSIIVDETSLSQFVFGIIEEITPVDFLKIILEIQPSLTHQQMSLCLYLIKELIKQDTDNEYIVQPHFSSLLSEIFDIAKQNNNFIIQDLNIIEKLNNFFVIKSGFAVNALCNKIKLRSYPIDLNTAKKNKNPKKLFVQDVCELMGDLLLKLTPLQFFDARKASQSILTDINPWQELLNVTNGISYMICWEILNAKKSDQRKKIFKFYQNCIDYCLTPEISNIGAAHAIYAGLNLAPIRRLKLEINDPVLGAYFNRNPGAITDLCMSSPNSIPPISFYVSYIMLVRENNKIENRIFLNGRLNFSLLLYHRLYALSNFSHGFTTNLKDKIEKVLAKYNEAEALYMSYNLMPKEIHLSEILSLDKLEERLDTQKRICAPLVVLYRKNTSKDAMAVDIIISYAKQKFAVELKENDEKKLRALCNEIIECSTPKRLPSIIIEEIPEITSPKKLRPHPYKKTHSEGNLPSSARVEYRNYVPDYSTKKKHNSLIEHQKFSPLPSPSTSRTDLEVEPQRVIIKRKKK